MRRVVFIDKDGTLLEDVPYNVDAERISFTPNAIAGLRLLTDAGFELVLVSNQSGVARGYFDEDALQALMRSLRKRLDGEGVPVLDALYCPHLPDAGCECRKPRPGMLLEAARQYDIDLGSSWLIGDILDDVEAGHRAGCRSVLLDRGGETQWLAGPYRTPTLVADDLLQAARRVVQTSNRLIAGGTLR